MNAALIVLARIAPKSSLMRSNPQSIIIGSLPGEIRPVTGHPAGQEVALTARKKTSGKAPESGRSGAMGGKADGTKPASRGRRRTEGEGDGRQATAVPDAGPVPSDDVLLPTKVRSVESAMPPDRAPSADIATRIHFSRCGLNGADFLRATFRRIFLGRARPTCRLAAPSTSRVSFFVLIRRSRK
jgi:hypothetical protein